MKIAHVLGFITFTGGDRITYNHIRILRKLGHQVDVYSAGIVNYYKENIEWNTIKNSILTFKDINSINFSNYDAVFLNGFAVNEYFSNLDVKNKIWFCQGFDRYIFAANGNNNKYDQVYFKTKKYLTCSLYLSKLIKYYYGDKITTECINGVEFDKLNNSVKIDLEKRISSNKICFMSAYNGPIKGTNLFLEFAKKAQKIGYEIIHISASKQKLDESFTYYYMPDDKRKFEIMNDCFCMIHTSVFETWSLVTMESMCIGLPTVGTNSYGLLTFANNDNMIFTDRNSDDIINKLKILKDKNTYKKYSDNCISTARKYDWGIIENNIEQSYNNIIRS